MGKRAVGLLALFIFLISMPVMAQTPVAALPVDSRKLFSIGITEFAGTNLSLENVYLKSSLPAQVKEQVEGITDHAFTQEERSAFRRWILTTELQKVFTELAVLSKKQDEEFFLDKKQYERDKLLADYEKKRLELLAKVNFYRAFDPEKIIFPEKKTVEIRTDAGKLLPAPAWSALQYSQKQDLDLLVTGSIEEIQGYLYLELAVYHRVLEKNIFYFREAGTREDITGYLLASVPKITTLLLGRDWAGLLVDVDPPFSFIKIDGELAGMGTVERSFYKPGEVKIEIDAPGYRSISETITLVPQTEERVEFTLEHSSSEVILAESIPPGAQVYLDALWMGTAPLVMERPEKISRLMFVLPGYNNEVMRVGPAITGSVRAVMLSLRIDWNQIRDQKRDNYYNALAAFILSLPFPIFSFSFARDAYGAGRDADFEFYSATYYWTFFISGALLVNMVVELLKYVQSADRPAG